MLDIKLIREDPAAAERALATRGAAVSLAPVLAVDTDRRRLLMVMQVLLALCAIGLALALLYYVTHRAQIEATSLADVRSPG